MRDKFECDNPNGPDYDVDEEELNEEELNEDESKNSYANQSYSCLSHFGDGK